MSDLYDMSGLDPAEIEKIERSLKAFRGSESPEQHGDAGEDMKMIRPLAEAVQMLNDKLSMLDEKVDKFSDFFFNEFVGGITKLYEGNAREEGLSALKGKFGSDFEPYGGYLEEIGEPDIMGKLYDHLKGHWDDEGFDPDDFVDDLLDQLEAKIESMRSRLAGKAEENPEEEEETEEGPEGNIDEGEIIDLTRRMRGKKAAS